MVRLTSLEKDSAINITQLSTPEPERPKQRWGVEFITPKDWEMVKRFVKSSMGRKLLDVVSRVDVVQRATGYDLVAFIPPVEDAFNEVVALLEGETTGLDVKAVASEALTQLAHMRQLYGDEIDALDSGTILTVQKLALAEIMEMQSSLDLFQTCRYLAMFRLAFPTVNVESYVSPHLLGRLSEYAGSSELSVGLWHVVFLRNLKLLYPSIADIHVDDELLSELIKTINSLREEYHTDTQLTLAEAAVILTAPHFELGPNGIVVSDDRQRNVATPEPLPTKRSF